jgi:hypothetical protein
LRPLIGSEEVEEEIGGDRERRDRDLFGDLQRGEQIREPGVVLDIRAMGAGELADAGDDRVGNRIGGGSGQWLILEARDGPRVLPAWLILCCDGGYFCRVTRQKVPRFTLY